MCLSPIKKFWNFKERLFRNNSSEFWESIKNKTGNSNKKIKIIIISDRNIGFVQSGANCDLYNGVIRINEVFLCAIWGICFLTVLSYETLNKYLTKQGENKLIIPKSEDIINCIKQEFAYSYTQWPKGLPSPYEDNCSFVKIANLIFPNVVNLILSHEIAHFCLDHNIDGPVAQEYEADEKAIEWVLNGVDELAKQLTIMSAFISMVLIDPYANKNNIKHPASFDRMINCLDKFEIEQNDILWAFGCLIFGFWDKTYNEDNIFRIDDSQDDSYRAHLINLVSTSKR